MFSFIPNEYFLLAFGLILLIKGGDWFVDAASGIAKRFHLPELLIGATVVSIGTTLPEVMTSAIGAMSGAGGIAYGNAIGSIICNTALIAATTIAIKPGKVDKKTLISLSVPSLLSRHSMYLSPTQQTDLRVGRVSFFFAPSLFIWSSMSLT